MVETISVKRYWDKFDDNTQELPEIVPSVVFKTRVRDYACYRRKWRKPNLRDAAHVVAAS